MRYLNCFPTNVDLWRNIGDISMLIADASKVKGTGVSMKIKEIVKGSGNTLYLLRIPVHAYMQGILSK
jgi:hypothetical protein